jgi:hypothetical protein
MFLKIRPMSYEVFHADRITDGRTGMKNPIVSFGNIANAPKGY